MKILVTVPMDPSGVALLEGLKDTVVELKPDISQQDLRGCVGDYDVLIAGTSTPVDRDVLEKAERLQLIGLMGMGRPQLDLETATHRGILVMNAPGSVSVSVAEHALSLIFALARRIPEADTTLKKGVWYEKKLMGREIRGKTLGIIGFGAVGSLVAERAIGMKMNVVVYDPHLSAESVIRRGCRQVSREELFSVSDIITVHAPLNRETEGILGEETIPLMKPGVLLVNCSASGIIDEDALYEAIIKGSVAGVALDLHSEAPIEEHPLYLSEKVICTPNLSIATFEAVVEGSMEIAREVADYLEKGEITQAVNLPADTNERSGRGIQWLKLGEVMGRFAAQLHPYGLQEVAIDLAGEEDLPGVASFTSSVLMGALVPVLGEGVNRINARSLAEERGIRVAEKRRNVSETYRSLLTVSVETDRGSGTVSGTLFDDQNPRLVQVDGFELEAVPDGGFLVIFNRDRPGVIADVGEALGRHGINIGQMYNGRDKAGEKAITLLRIDAPLEDDVLHEIQELPNILNATRVNLTTSCP
jgi:D-3-phosphoglycerate dehydrogenase